MKHSQLNLGFFFLFSIYTITGNWSLFIFPSQHNFFLLFFQSNGPRLQITENWRHHQRGHLRHWNGQGLSTQGQYGHRVEGQRVTVRNTNSTGWYVSALNCLLLRDCLPFFPETKEQRLNEIQGSTGKKLNLIFTLMDTGLFSCWDS